MLTELNLKNYAIIDSLHLSFSKGLNIITGETGTGKSIIVDAINIILGDKAGSDIIKSGRDESVIEAVFDLGEREDITGLLNKYGIDAQDDELVIRRIIPRQGRGRTFVNDTTVTLKLLANITEELIDIFSQHEHQSLTREKNHIGYLDLFMNNDELKAKYKVTYEEYRSVNNKLEKLRSSIRDNSEKKDYLKFQLQELTAFNPKPGEDSELEQEEEILSNSEEISETVNEASRITYEGDESVYVLLNRVLKNLNNIADLDPSLAEISKSLNDTVISLDDIAQSLRNYSESIKHDPARLDQISARLAEINKMKRKHATDMNGLVEKISELRVSLDQLENTDSNIEQMENQSKELGKKLEVMANELSMERKKASDTLVERFNSEARFVGLKDAKFEVNFTEKEPGPDGKDKVKFFFSANPGEPPRELAKVASGGELSRVMLLLKELLTKSDNRAVLIFDEADSGIGGVVAETIGKKIRSLSVNNQVFCITHLPQVAKFADSHYMVEKHTENNTTRITVNILDENSRVKELGRMLAGETVTDKTLEVAREMLGNR